MTDAGSLSARLDNNFGFLRVSLAILVIFAHSFDLLGAGSVEPRLGTIPCGGLAVDGFFLISGYLITMSGERSSSYRQYLTNRVLRIYPGYAAAYLISVLIIAPMGGGDITAVLNLNGLAHLYRILLLRTPYVPGTFQGLPYAILNQPMWTIAYEFRCYLLVIALTVSGFNSRPRAYLTLTIGMWALSCTAYDVPMPDKVIDIIGDPRLVIHFASMFLCGGAFYRFRSRILYSRHWAFVAMLCLWIMSSSPRFAGPAVGLFGGYVLFWFALSFKSQAISRIGARTDLSYGIYLYGWPIQNLIIWHDREISWTSLFPLALGITAIVALFSWTLIELPCLRLKGRTSRVLSQFRTAG